MSVLVGFSGASGSGKTTLVKALYERLKKDGYNVGIVNEVARIVFNKYKDVFDWKSLDQIRNSEKVKLYQKLILTHQYQYEEKALREYDIVLTDRTLYDSLMYTLLHINDLHYLANYVSLFLKYKPKERYDVVFLCSPVNSNLNDGFRTAVDIATQTLQHELLKMLLHDYVLLDGDFATRFADALSIIKLYVL